MENVAHHVVCSFCYRDNSDTHWNVKVEFVITRSLQRNCRTIICLNFDWFNCLFEKYHRSECLNVNVFWISKVWFSFEQWPENGKKFLAIPKLRSRPTIFYCIHSADFDETFALRSISRIRLGIGWSTSCIIWRLEVGIGFFTARSTGSERSTGISAFRDLGFWSFESAYVVDLCLNFSRLFNNTFGKGNI